MKRIFIFFILFFLTLQNTFADDYTFVFPKLQTLVEMWALLDISLDWVDLNTPLISDTDSRERFCLLKWWVVVDYVNWTNKSNRDRIDFKVSSNFWRLDNDKKYLAWITCNILVYWGNTWSWFVSPYDTLILDELLSIKNELVVNSNKTSFIIELYLYLSSLFIFFVSFKYSFRTFRKLQFVYPRVKGKFNL